MYTLHGCYRFTDAWRMRIALDLKELPVRRLPHHSRRGEQRAPDFLALNPQGLPPMFEAAGEAGAAVLTQYPGIIEYLDGTHPDPSLLLADPLARARLRAFAPAIACGIHPVQNLRVLSRPRTLGLAEPQVQAWAHDTTTDGLATCEALLAGQPGPCCSSVASGLANVLPGAATIQRPALCSPAGWYGAAAAGGGRLPDPDSLRRRRGGAATRRRATCSLANGCLKIYVAAHHLSFPGR